MEKERKSNKKATSKEEKDISPFFPFLFVFFSFVFFSSLLFLFFSYFFLHKKHRKDNSADEDEGTNKKATIEEEKDVSPFFPFLFVFFSFCFVFFSFVLFSFLLFLFFFLPFSQGARER